MTGEAPPGPRGSFAGEAPPGATGAFPFDGAVRSEGEHGEARRESLGRPGAPVQGAVQRIAGDDGRAVPFERARLAASVRRSQAEAGDDDPGFADEIAAIVALALERERAAGADPPTADRIGELVERVLVELGRTPVARAYIVARARRAAARAALRGEPSRAGSGAGATPMRLPDVRGRDGTEAWNPARIVAALVEEAGLPRERATEVAERVEARVAGAGLGRLSTGLVRELVGNELFSMGLAGALRANEALGLPRYDLRRIDTEVRARRPGAEDGPRLGAPEARSLEERVAGEILRRHALEDVLGEVAAERHRSGEHHFADLEQPQRVLWRSLPAELLLRREPEACSPIEVALDAATLAAGTARGLVLEEIGRVVQPALRAQRTNAVLRDFLLALAAGAEGARRRIDLARPIGVLQPSGRGGDFVARLLLVLDELSSERIPAPRLALTFAELSAAKAAADGGEAARETSARAERLVAAGRLVPAFGGSEGDFAAPGCTRRSGDRAPAALGSAVALNLPRAARRAGPWREDALFASLAAAVDAGLDGLASLDAHQRDARRAHGEPLRERTVHAVVPAGLDEALRILGDGAARPEVGARVLGLLVDATTRFAKARGLHVRVACLEDDGLGLRFARLDRAMHGAQQRRLFADLPRPEEVDMSSYSVGFDVPSLRRQPLHAADRAGAPEAHGAALAEWLATVPAGALYGLSVAGDGEFPHLAAWQAFDERRRRFAPGPEGGRLGNL